MQQAFDVFKSMHGLVLPVLGYGFSGTCTPIAKPPTASHRFVPAACALRLGIHGRVNVMYELSRIVNQ